MEKGKIKKIFLEGHTAKGFHSLAGDIVSGLERLFVLKGGPGTGKSTLIKCVALEMLDRGYDVELLCCASDSNSLDGLLIPALKVGVVDGTAPHVIDPCCPGVTGEIVNLGEYWDDGLLMRHKQEIIAYTEQIENLFQKAYGYLQQAKAIHDEWEAYHLEGMDFTMANAIAENIILEIFTRKPLVRHLFSSAVTPDGPVDHIASITADCKQRFILKGPPGTGKSTLMQKVAQAALERGYAVDVYHCSFDPDSLDAVVIPELSVALLDGSDPHVPGPKRTGDRIVEMLDCVDPNVLAKNSEAITETAKRYYKVFHRAIDSIKQAKSLHDDLEFYYVSAMDFAGVDSARENIISKILQFAAAREKR